MAETGTHDLGPSVGTMLLMTTSEGAMARVGHHLTLEVDDWSGRLVVGEAPEQSSVTMRAGLGSLRVVDARGGAKPLSEDDRAAIVRNAAKVLQTQDHPELEFTSTAVEGDWSAGTLRGTLTFHGQSHPQEFAVEQTEGGYRLTGVIAQSRFGVKPYTAMMGALKLGDDVRVEVTVTL